jgi:integrase
MSPKQKNSEQRKREYLTDFEIERLIKAATQHGRHGLPDDTIVLIIFRHWLRASELAALRWEQIDLKKALVQAHRIKNGLPSTHPLRGIELRLLRQLEHLHPQSAYVFISERKAPLPNRSVHYIIGRAGENAKLPFTVYPHMLRHSTGFYLASDGHDTRAIQGYLRTCQYQ